MAEKTPQRTLADYADLIDLPHPVSTRRQPMPIHDRAAQFAPYDALTGYSAMVRETARLTDEDADLDEGQMEAISLRLQLIGEALERGEQPAVEITSFVPDARKRGGSYEITVGMVRRLDPIGGSVILTNRRELPIATIRQIRSELFAALDEGSEP